MRPEELLESVQTCFLKLAGNMESSSFFQPELFMHPSLTLAWTPGPTELIIILVVILILFGPKKLPDLSRAIGKSIGEFKRGRKEVDDELKKLSEDDEPVKTETKE